MFMKRTLFFAIIALFFLPNLLFADLYMKSVTRTDPFQMMGQRQEATSATQEVWIGENKMRLDSEGNSIIFNLENNQFYILYHRQKKYFQTALPIDMKNILPEDQADFMDMMKFTLKIEPLGEKRKIKEWDCTNYKMEMTSQMVNITSTIWATEDIKVDQESLNKFYMNTSALQNIASETLEEFTKIKGVQVMTESSSEIMGTEVRQRTELQTAEIVELPKDHYSIPEGYERSVNFLPIG